LCPCPDHLAGGVVDVMEHMDRMDPMDAPA